jgi:ATP-dependent RNA helicase DDX21
MYDEQRQFLRDGLDIVVGTPGRLIDHIERGFLSLASIRFVCLDEADQMLDIGFKDDMEKTLQMVLDQTGGHHHQTLLFSATLPEWIKEAIQKYMNKDRITLDLIGTSKQMTSQTVTHYCLPSRWQNRTDILGDIVACYGQGNNGRTIVFVETKNEANELVMNDKLVAMGAQVLHGDISQNQREKTMEGYRQGKFSCLITTNVCARGVDIPEVDLVINAEPPQDVESYIHRSGRTGRAGRSGSCVTFFKQQQEYLIENIKKRAGVQFIKIGAPQPADIVKARASQNIQVLKQVDPLVYPYFDAAAQELLDHFEGDSMKALSCAFAVICQTVKPLPKRSLLTANEGWVTLLFTTTNEIRNVGYIRSMLQKTYTNLTFDDTIGWKMTADSKGVLVDVKQEKIFIEQDIISIAGNRWRDGKGVGLTIPTDLPEVQVSSYGGSVGRGGFSSGGRGSYGRGGASNNFSSRGRGGSSSYSSRRGRGR